MLNPDSSSEKYTALNYRCTKNSQCDKIHIFKKHNKANSIEDFERFALNKINTLNKNTGHL